MLECRGVNAQVGSFGLRDITLTIAAGGHAVLTGPTASGKTTLLEVIAGAIPASSGTVLSAGVDVTILPPEMRGVGLVPQHGYLFPHLDVRRNVAYGADRSDTSVDLATHFEIGHLLDRAVSSLSGGERQLVALCRALAAQPSVVLLDEAFSALDAARRQLALLQFSTLQRDTGFTALHVTHLESDSAFATQRFEMLDGLLK